MTVLDALTWLQATAVARLVTESLWGFPILVTLHIVGLGLSAGTILWFDLRLLGVAFRGCPVSETYRRLIPWASAGFVIMLVTGALLFSGYATNAYGNAFFRLKLGAFVLAGANALFYHRVTESSTGEWDTAERLPRAARLAGLVSIVAWATAILAGRMMSYTMF